MPFLGTTKQRGELAEVLFIERALRLGYDISKPYGDSAPYDVVVGGLSPRLKRVQVKSAWVEPQSGRYSFHGGSHAHLYYTAKEIDFLVVYLAPRDLWYIIPVAAFSPRMHLRFTPGDPDHDEWTRYREAWSRLGRVRPVRHPGLRC